MKNELKEKEVLAMYDVRGIQNYIFKSNAAKEIIGASALIDGIIVKGLQKYLSEKVNDEERKYYMTDWKQDEVEKFQQDQKIQMQVMFVGGGNAYVLYRKGAICQRVNRFLAKYILDTTYSLNLAVAVVEKSNSYADDYQNINLEMQRIKAEMSLAQPMGALPFMAVDSITGYPISVYDSKENKYFCTEAKKKRDAFPKNESEQIFDKMVTEKGADSMLAVCHIDGNSMGIHIREKIEGICEYGEAMKRMREISKEISDTFRSVFDGMAAFMDELSAKVRKDSKNKLYREIIVAGDDITFVCNAKLAIPAVKYFLEHIGDEKDYSACGGIAYFNSHFPFSDAYQVAEACCSMAKKRAKEENSRGKNESVGNFFDFQICTNIRAAHLESYREKHYHSEKGMFILRPYYVPIKRDINRINEKNKDYSVEKLEKWSKIFKGMSRSRAKMLRNSMWAKDKREEAISFLASRGYQELENRKTEYPVWYDALEIMDLYIGGDGQNEDQN